MSSPRPPQPAIVDRESALRFLYARVDFERFQSIPYQDDRFKLDRMRELLARLGNPLRGVPVVHVAGTKGKGSTSAMVAAVLTAAGIRTGLFTSPHLDNLEERIAVGGLACTSDELVSLVESVRPVVESMDHSGQADEAPTFFEITTALALVYFARRGVQAAVLEVGLGGRLDSTNVCQPSVSVITSISYDHTRQLGNTLEAIAAEKAGIIKPGVPVISGVAGEGPQGVIRETCRRLGCGLTELDVDFRYRYRAPVRLEQAPGYARLDYFQPADAPQPKLANVELSLLGRHQASNAAVALATLEQLRRDGWDLPESAMRSALRDLRWPARIEVVARRPAVVIDAAHNVASIAALLETLDESFSPRRRYLLLAMTRDKDLAGMLRQVLGHFDEVVLTRYSNSPRAVPAEELGDLAQQLTGRRPPVIPDPEAAWAELRRRATPEDLICVTGSFFIAAEVRKWAVEGRQ